MTASSLSGLVPPHLRLKGARFHEPTRTLPQQRHNHDLEYLGRMGWLVENKDLPQVVRDYERIGYPRQAIDTIRAGWYAEFNEFTAAAQALRNQTTRESKA